MSITEDLTAVEVALTEFFARHRTSELALEDHFDRKAIFLKKPWNDASLGIAFPENWRPLVQTLLTLTFFERFSAIYHRKMRSLEVIWTAFEIPVERKDLIGRNFEITHRKVGHQCIFSASSDELISLAECIVPEGPSEKSYRNLQSYRMYASMSEDVRAQLSPDGPLSFWINNVDEDEDYLIDLCSNLNFYLRYYDDRSPIVLIHDPEPSAAKPRQRFIAGAFPEKITSKSLDENLLSFWNFASTISNPSIRFTFYYRIIEYSAYHYVESSSRMGLRRVLNAPNFDPQSSEAIEKIAAVFSGAKIDDVPRFNALIRNCVDPRLLWAEIEPNREFFSKELQFDGGFILRPLISIKENEDTFNTKGIEVKASPVSSGAT